MKNQRGFIHIAVLITIALIVVVLVGVAFWYDSEGGLANSETVSVISSFDDCVSAGYPVMESYPRQCAVNGVTYVDTITNQNLNIDTNQNTNSVLLSEDAKLQIATYTGQTCTTDDDCGIFPCLNGSCLIKECTCSCGCSGNECGGDDSEAPGYCITTN